MERRWLGNGWKRRSVLAESATLAWSHDLRDRALILHMTQKVVARKKSRPHSSPPAPNLVNAAMSSLYSTALAERSLTPTVNTLQLNKYDIVLEYLTIYYRSVIKAYITALGDTRAGDSDEKTLPQTGVNDTR